MVVPPDHCIPGCLVEYRVTQRKYANQLAVRLIPDQEPHTPSITVRDRHLPIERRHTEQVGLPRITLDQFQFRADRIRHNLYTVREPLHQGTLAPSQPSQVRSELLLPLASVKAPIRVLVEAWWLQASVRVALEPQIMQMVSYETFEFRLPCIQFDDFSLAHFISAKALGRSRASS